jgi:hypothetical protein
MPTYTFLDTTTNEQQDDRMSIADKEAYLEANPHIRQVPVGFAGIGDSSRLRKPDDSFRDILRNIKKEHSGSKVNCW